jgi:nitroreductase
VTEPSPLGQHPQAPAWFAAVESRHSRRAFDPAPVADELLTPLAACCQSLHPFADARVAFVRDPAVDVFKGAIGSYGKVTGSPHLLVFIASESPLAQQHAGYIGEACVLEATRLGLHTCWVGGFFDRKRLKSVLPLEAHERAVAVSPVGRAVSAHSGSERTMERMAGSHHRKPLEEIAERSGEWPQWARAAVECARLAPSATNRQPWRFRYEGEELILAKSHGPELPMVTKRLDCGIAMLHAELGALNVGVRGLWRECPTGREVARFRPMGVEQ